LIVSRAGPNQTESPSGGIRKHPRPGLTFASASLSALGLALADLPQHCADTLLGQTRLTFPATLLSLEALHRCQKPCCFWLAIYHGENSFRIVRPGECSGITAVGVTGPDSGGLHLPARPGAPPLPVLRQRTTGPSFVYTNLRRRVQQSNPKVPFFCAFSPSFARRLSAPPRARPTGIGVEGSISSTRLFYKPLPGTSQPALDESAPWRGGAGDLGHRGDFAISWSPVGKDGWRCKLYCRLGLRWPDSLFATLPPPHGRVCGGCLRVDR
jgi:hypothetical protein